MAKTEHSYNKNMKSINDLPQSEFNMKNMLDLRYDEQRGIVKIFNIRGKLIIEEDGKRRFL